MRCVALDPTLRLVLASAMRRARADCSRDVLAGLRVILRVLHTGGPVDFRSSYDGRRNHPCQYLDRSAGSVSVRLIWPDRVPADAAVFVLNRASGQWSTLQEQWPG